MSRASQTAEQVKGELGHMLNAWQDDALRESIAAAQSRGLDVDRAMRSLAASGQRFDLKAVLDALRPPAGSASDVPYHLPTCRCGGEGWVDGQPERNLGRTYRTIARCDQGGPITQAVWDSWQISGAQWTPPATDTDVITRRAAARRMTAAARAALPARPTTETTDAPQAI